MTFADDTAITTLEWPTNWTRLRPPATSTV